MDFTKFSKLEPQGARPKAEPEGTVSAVVKVSEGGYRPPGVQVRADISPVLFTADISAEAIASLQADPKVESVSLARPIPLQKHVGYR